MSNEPSNPDADDAEALKRIETCRQQGRQGQELDLAVLSLRTLPPEIGQLTNLTRLSLGNNQLSTLPPEIGQLSNLKTLSLDNNQLSTLPPEIGQLTNLTILLLSGNQLSTLPPEIGQLINLTILFLDNNQLSTLPPEIGQLTNLTGLYLYDNQLSTLPPVIGHLTNLTSLYLNGNQLSTLPAEITRLVELTHLFLHDNPGLGLPAEVLGPVWDEVALNKATAKPPKDILDWYFRNRSAHVKRPILEAKVILVGWGAVGKTSLRRRLIDGSFDNREETTHKIEITAWPVKVGNDQVKLHVWDFGGQEIMHATHQFFLTKRSLYVLVLAGREKVQGAQDAEYWLRLIQSFGGGSPVLVVLNKQHICPFDLNRQSLMEKYPFIKGFVQTDCEPPLRLDELKEMIVREVNNLPGLRTEFDAKWMAIKDSVTDLKRKGSKRMAVTDYVKLCLTKEELEEKWQKWLLGFLHDLGIVVCFHDDHRLADDGLLDPQWMVDGIYTVLNEPTLKGGDGRVTHAEVRNLLSKADYSDDDVRVLLDLMEKFELCFWPGGNRTALVVPELMTEQEGDWKANFPEMDRCLRFELRYDFLPEGLMPRFIVATHDLSRAGERWRSGAILREGNNAALVRGDAAGSPPSIRIAVNGPVPTRRELLAIIRREFVKINASIPGLGAKEMVPVPGLNVDLLNFDDLVAAEEAGDKDWPVVANGVRHKILLATLLDGIEPKEKRKARAAQKRQEPPIHVEKVVFDHSIHIRDVINSQVGQTLTDCINAIKQQPAGEKRTRLEDLERDVDHLIQCLPADKEDVATEVAEYLEIFIAAATKTRPNRRSYDAAARGLLEAATAVKDYSGTITATILALGKQLWPNFQLPS